MRKFSAQQMRVLALIDNNMSTWHGTNGDRNAGIARSRTVRSLQDAGVLDGERITEKGYKLFDAQRNNRDPSTK